MGKDDSGLSAVLCPYDEDVGPVVDDDTALAGTALPARAVEITGDLAERQNLLVKVERLLERADVPLRAAEALFFYAAGVLALAIGGLFGLGVGAGLFCVFPSLFVVVIGPAIISVATTL